MGKYYGNVEVKTKKPKKKKNEHNRYRNVIKNFRVTPKERDLIEARLAVTGMKRSTFFIQSCLYQKILVKGNIKTFDAIRKEMKEIAFRLQEMTGSNEPDHYTTESLRMILEILDGFYGKMD